MEGEGRGAAEPSSAASMPATSGASCQRWRTPALFMLVCTLAFSLAGAVVIATNQIGGGGWRASLALGPAIVVVVAFFAYVRPPAPLSEHSREGGRHPGSSQCKEKPIPPEGTPGPVSTIQQRPHAIAYARSPARSSEHSAETPQDPGSSQRQDKPVQPDDALVPGRRPRIYWLDNLKLLLSCVVVGAHAGQVFDFGHYIGLGGYPNWFRPTAKALTVLLSSFTIPSFYFVSGFFTALSISHKGPRAFLRHAISQLAPVFLVFFFLVDAGMQWASREVFRDPPRGSPYYPEIGIRWYLLWLMVFQTAYAHIGSSNVRWCTQPRTKATCAAQQLPSSDTNADAPATVVVLDGQQLSRPSSRASDSEAVDIPVVANNSERVDASVQQQGVPVIFTLMGVAVVVAIVQTCIAGAVVLAGDVLFLAGMPVGSPGNGLLCSLWFVAGALAREHDWLSHPLPRRHILVSRVTASCTATAAFVTAFLVFHPRTSIDVDMAINVYFTAFAVLGTPGAVAVTILMLNTFQRRVTREFKPSKLYFGIYLFHSWFVVLFTWSYVRILETTTGVDVVWSGQEVISNTDLGSGGLLYAGFLYITVTSLIASACVTALFGTIPGLKQYMGLR